VSATNSKSDVIANHFSLFGSRWSVFGWDNKKKLYGFERGVAACANCVQKKYFCLQFNHKIVYNIFGRAKFDRLCCF
jgi:hypothetical protein